jgi:hypothetical protein
VVLSELPSTTNKLEVASKDNVDDDIKIDDSAEDSHANDRKDLNDDEIVSGELPKPTSKLDVDDEMHTNYSAEDSHTNDEQSLLWHARAKYVKELNEAHNTAKKLFRSQWEEARRK